MSLTNPPAVITSLRDMLLQCSTVTTASVTTAKMFYPQIALAADDSTTPAALPLCLLSYESESRDNYAEGAYGLPSGSLTATFYFDAASYTIGQTELFAENTMKDLSLVSLSQGVHITGMRSSRCGDADSSMFAADAQHSNAAMRAITIDIDYGLRA
jgi:hypothetical protein